VARLKLFRTAIGFHDAYVAAPSRKAALAAWGADADLFARGMAEEVADGGDAAAAAMAAPGEVIRVARGTVEDHLAALPPAAATARRRRAAPAAPQKPPPRPRPSREPLDAAEAALADEARAHAVRLRALAQREAELARERRAAERDHADAAARLERARDTAQAAYDRAMGQWRR